MGRLNDWMDTTREKRMDYAGVIEDQPLQVDVYRVPERGTGVGFSEEVADPEFSHRLVARIDRAAAHGRSDTDAGDSVEYPLMATTLDDDVRITDIWKWNGREMQVVSIDDRDKVRVEVTLREFRNESVSLD